MVETRNHWYQTSQNHQISRGGLTIRFNGWNLKNNFWYQKTKNHQNFLQNGWYLIKWLKTIGIKILKTIRIFKKWLMRCFLINLLTLWFCNEPILEEEFTSSILMVGWWLLEWLSKCKIQLDATMSEGHCLRSSRLTRGSTST